MNRVAFLFPGQGAQYPGMLKDFCDAFARAREVVEEADRVLGYAFSEILFSGSREELMATKNAQLAVYIASIAIVRVMQEEFPEIQPVVCAGLSLGEYTALTAAGNLSLSECLPLVALRAELMEAACVEHPGTMRVVLGLDEERVRAALQQIAPVRVWVANLNCPGQVVISGEVADMGRAEEALKQHGARRVLPLDVSGAFHSPLMQEAQKKLEPALLEVPLRETPIDLVMNVTGDVVKECEKMREMLVQQVTSPVYWEKGIRTMMGLGVSAFFEIGPGKALAGMNQRIGVDVPTRSIGKVEDIEVYAASTR